MKIKTSITEQIEMDITLPFFRKDNSYSSEKYIAVLDEKTQITVFHNELRSHISLDVPSTNDSDLAKAYKTWEEVSEGEFLAFHEKILKSLSLTPQLCEKEFTQEFKDHDDLKDVNI